MRKKINKPQRYSIIRFVFRSGRSVVQTGLTLDEAQEHCRDPQTSSRTATDPDKVKFTKENGPWFDGYEKED